MRDVQEHCHKLRPRGQIYSSVQFSIPAESRRIFISPSPASIATWMHLVWLSFEKRFNRYQTRFIIFSEALYTGNLDKISFALMLGRINKDLIYFSFLTWGWLFILSGHILPKAVHCHNVHCFGFMSMFLNKPTASSK